MSKPAARPPAHEIRLIGGRWKRTKLPVPDLPGLRPTLDRVRETLFNWLGQDLSGWRCLDAFAGTGALGLEAASRGAQQVVLLERDPRLVQQLRAVLERLQGAEAVQVVCTDALAWMRRCEPQRFDLVFLDPPFAAGLFGPALREAVRLVPRGGWIYLESADAEPVDLEGLGLELWREQTAGAVRFRLLRRLH
ncbi:MAG: 16S rRNA (guanine(966)-N(2))-methyltransferase RsmD [Pseudomonadota bacterium]|uniref:16S rRNA (Guanine(966)-N(2))-methyltransferase RsmD n=1 Tax=Caldimonas aquatica TaxID=376175 RepID=A0ABY6MR14_9BURK|nr:16S rRNA (guanine(966)-N(2))-methyltransferase RsmD [Schlegelella aquatica]UZD54440.1 16S rRNA (guanine(966)-N(2))-methyltransferase RsmD [Schlegelella aquatica]